MGTQISRWKYVVLLHGGLWNAVYLCAVESLRLGLPNPVKLGLHMTNSNSSVVDLVPSSNLRELGPDMTSITYR